jgi:hypothetical protein
MAVVPMLVQALNFGYEEASSAVEKEEILCDIYGSADVPFITKWD